MHRSQIILKEDQYAYLVNKAQRQGKSISQIVRELIDDHMARTRDLENAAFFGTLCGGGGGDLTPPFAHDSYVYGLPRRSESKPE